jgi:hypothetical protein
VQQSKDEQILKIENEAASMIQQINAYKETTTLAHLKNRTLFKEKFAQRLTQLKQSNEDNNLMLHEKNSVTKEIFNNSFLQYKLDFTRPDQLGSLDFQRQNVINAEHDLKPISAATQLPSHLESHVVFRYLTNGQCLLAFDVRGKDDDGVNKLDMFILNEDKTVKVAKRNMQPIGEEYWTSLYVVGEKIVYQVKNGHVLVYNSDLSLVDKFENTIRFSSDDEEDDDSFDDDMRFHTNEGKHVKYHLIGACVSGLYFALEDEPNQIEVCDWSFNHIETLSTSIEETSQITRMRYHEGKYYFFDCDQSLVIMKKTNELCHPEKKLTEELFSERFEIDVSSKLLICFNTMCPDPLYRKLMVYDLEGNFKYDISFENFYKDLKDDDFEYEDDYVTAYSDWMDVVDFQGDRIHFLDVETFTFNEVIFDNFLLASINQQ